MTGFTRLDAAFLTAVTATLGISLVAGLALAPRPFQPKTEAEKPVIRTAPAGFDPFAVDQSRVTAAAAGLGETRRADSARLESAIREALADDPLDFPAALDAASKIAEAGEAAAPVALSLLRDASPDARRMGAILAGRAGCACLVPLLARGLDDDSWEMQGECARALGECGDRSAVVDLLTWQAERLNKYRHPVVRVLVSEALLNLGNTAYVHHLVSAMYDKVFEGDIAASALVRHSGQNIFYDREAVVVDREAAATAWATWWLQWKGWFKPLKPAPDRTDQDRLAFLLERLAGYLGGAQYFNLYQTTEILSLCGDLAVPMLVDCLWRGDLSCSSDSNAHCRVNACETLRLMISAGVQPAPDPALLAPQMIRSLSGDSSPAVRAGAARVLALLKDRRAVDPLLEAVSADADPSVRIEAARALCNLGFSDPIDGLVAADPGSDQVLAFEIASAIASCDRKDELGPVIDALEKGLSGQGTRGLAEEARLRLMTLTGRRSALPADPEAIPGFVQSWRRMAAARLSLRETAAAGRFDAEAAVEFAKMFGPKVAPLPRDDSALDFAREWASVWKILFDIRMGREKADDAAIAGNVARLEKLTGVRTGLHPRAPQQAFFEELDRWEAWAELNGPGRAPD